MQTSYYTTTRCIRRAGNLVDLGEYRRRLALAQSDSLARQPQPSHWPGREIPAFRPKVLPARTRRARRFAWALDMAASLAVVVVTLAFALWTML